MGKVGDRKPQGSLKHLLPLLRFLGTQRVCVDVPPAFMPTSQRLLALRLPATFLGVLISSRGQQLSGVPASVLGPSGLSPVSC